MPDTKESILMTALRLFARDGYQAVSVSAIAGELGMTKGALYKHYRNKRDIFDSIVQRMYQIDAERSHEYEVPEQTHEQCPESYNDVSIERIADFTVAQFLFWTEDDFASAFRRMLTLEQYRDAEMGELYRSCLTVGPVAYLEDIFRHMVREGTLREADPRQLALAFYAPFHLLLSISDRPEDRKDALTRLQRHITDFMQQNAARKEKENEIRQK